MPSEFSILEWLLQQTGPTVTAILALWFMQQNHRAYMERERENAVIHREDKRAMMQILAETNVSKTKLVEVINHLEKTIDRRNRVLESMNDQGRVA